MKSARLDYTVRAVFAVTCSDDLIVVRDADGKHLHIHSWGCDEMTAVSSQQLGLAQQEEINRISCGVGGMMHLAVWDIQKKRITRINTYKVCILMCQAYISCTLHLYVCCSHNIN